MKEGLTIIPDGIYGDVEISDGRTERNAVETVIVTGEQLKAQKPRTRRIQGVPSDIYGEFAR